MRPAVAAFNENVGTAEAVRRATAATADPGRHSAVVGIRNAVPLALALWAAIALLWWLP